MKYLTVLAGIALCFASCTNTNKAEAEKTAEDETAKTEAEIKAIDGQWQLTQYTVDGNEVKVDADNEYVLTFLPTDSTFSMTTSCNNVGGKYVVNGDSIKFDNLMSTRMMCPDMSIEEAMSKVFVNATTVNVENDTVLQLKNADAVLAQFNKKAVTEEAPAEDAAAETAQN